MSVNINSLHNWHSDSSAPGIFVEEYLRTCVENVAVGMSKGEMVH